MFDGIWWNVINRFFEGCYFAHSTKCSCESTVRFFYEMFPSLLNKTDVDKDFVGMTQERWKKESRRVDSLCEWLEIKIPAVSDSENRNTKISVPIAWYNRLLIYSLIHCIYDWLLIFAASFIVVWWVCFWFLFVCLLFYMEH